MNLPRSHRLVRALALVAVVGLPLACGDDEDAATDSTTPATADGAFPVTVEHALGSTTVEAAPQRIVTVGVTEQDTVLALGVTPVGVTEWYGDQPDATWPWAQDELGDEDPTVLSTSDGFQFERIAALDPDLIIGTSAGIDGAAFDTLSGIAPTIAHPAGGEPYFAPWDEQARLIAAAMGRTADMERIIGDIDAQFAAARAEHPEFAGVPIVFLQNAFYDGNAIAYQDGLSTKFLTDLGFTIPTALAEYATDGQAFIPMEELSVLDDADVLLWATESPSDREALEEEALYRALQAVEEGKLVFTDGITAGAIYFTSPLSLPFVLDRLVPALASTLAGDGPVEIDSATPTAG